MAKIIWISDFDAKGSGYAKVSIPLCQGLAELGHEIWAIGINYAGNEHDFDFHIIPARTFPEVHAMLKNLKNMENPDLVIVALDIPQHDHLVKLSKQLELDYICITPLENPPLTMSWAAPLLSADGVYFISEIGAEAARKSGVVNAEHIQMGIDKMWVMPLDDDKQRIRKGMGFTDNFVVLTVADNQERKNLSAALGMVCMVVYGLTKKQFKAIESGKKRISEFQKKVTNLKYVLITREHLTFGWRLRDLAAEYGINEELVLVERGLPLSALWAYYVASDLYLITSKAEGLCLPALESMACGVPVLAAETGAIPELLEDGKGYIIPIEHSFRDVWGNGRRDMVDIEAGAKLLRELMETDMSEIVDKAKKYVDSRTWDIPITQLNKKIEELTNG